jgi:uncharacterized protein (DUF1697 family)
MPVYVAMLRGINVGPHKRMKMDKLRASCEALGFEQVKTYIQSGNIVFQAGKLKADAVAKRLAERIVGDFGFTVEIILRTKDEMQQIIKRNPLAKDHGADQAKMHVVFLAEAPKLEALKKLESLTLPPEKIRTSGKEVYFYLPNGVSGSSLWKQPTDRILVVPSTMRNWRTVTTLYEMAEACG